MGSIFTHAKEDFELETIIDTSENDFIDLNRAKSTPSYQTTPSKISRNTLNTPPKSMHLSLEGEYLYWKPYAFIPYAIKNNLTGAGFETNYQNPQLNLKPHFGFRGVLGIYLPTPTWYVTSSYTQFLSTGSSFISTEGRSRRNELKLSYIWAAVSPVSGANTGPGDASATEKVFYRNIDVLLNRDFVCSSCFNLDTFFGVRYSRIAVSMDILYTEQDASSGQFGKVRVQLGNHFNAIGMNAGMKGNWKLPKGFEIFSKASLSSLVGRFFLKNQQHIFRPSDGDLSPIITNDNKFSDIYISTQLALGLSWGVFFNKNAHLRLQAGYELNVWPGLIRIEEIPNQSSFFTRTVPFKNFLSMQGLTASIKVDF